MLIHNSLYCKYDGASGLREQRELTFVFEFVLRDTELGYNVDCLLILILGKLKLFYLIFYFYKSTIQTDWEAAEAGI